MINIVLLARNKTASVQFDTTFLSNNGKIAFQDNIVRSIKCPLIGDQVSIDFIRYEIIDKSNMGQQSQKLFLSMNKTVART